MRSGSSSAISTSDLVEAEKAVLSDICERIAASFIVSGDQQQADASYNEALQHSPNNIKAMLGIANQCRSKGDVEQCQRQRRKIISADPSHEQATVLLSETLFLGSDPDSAVAPLESLLRAHPNNYRALERLISLLRRSGKLEDVPAVLTAAAAKDKRSGSHAGFRFCQGLYARFTNDIGKVITKQLFYTKTEFHYSLRAHTDFVFVLTSLQMSSLLLIFVSLLSCGYCCLCCCCKREFDSGHLRVQSGSKGRCMGRGSSHPHDRAVLEPRPRGCVGGEGWRTHGRTCVGQRVCGQFAAE